MRPSAEGWSDLAQLIDLRAGLLVAEATIRRRARSARVAGLPQPERLPASSIPTLQVNVHHRLDDDGRLVDPWTAVVGPVPDELLAWLGRRDSVDFRGRLLE